jgi:hypothetical protein
MFAFPHRTSLIHLITEKSVIPSVALSVSVWVWLLRCAPLFFCGEASEGMGAVLPDDCQDYLGAGEGIPALCLNQMADLDE